jgi:uncharacterized membrane protein YidH (DUF202 family)
VNDPTDPGPRHGRPDGDAEIGVAERVEFAWHRTALALAGIGLVLVRRIVPAIPVRPALGVFLIAVGVLSGAAVVAWREYAARRAVSRRAHLRLITGAAVAIGVVSLVVGATR